MLNIVTSGHNEHSEMVAAMLTIFAVALGLVAARTRRFLRLGDWGGPVLAVGGMVPLAMFVGAWPFYQRVDPDMPVTPDLDIVVIGLALAFPFVLWASYLFFARRGRQ